MDTHALCMHARSMQDVVKLLSVWDKFNMRRSQEPVFQESGE